MHTRLCDLLGIEHPIIQAGMGAFTSADLVVAVCESGALGSLGSSLRSASDLRDEIERIRARTDRPFAVNFLVSDLDEEAFTVALDARVPVISFALGDPGALVERAHTAGALVLHQIHTPAQAREAAGRGVDAVIAQGGEAGGFGQYVATMPLIPQVVDAVGLPVVAAGGIADGRGLAAALVLGADGVNLGTRFLASVEAPIAPGWKQSILSAESDQTAKVAFWNTVFPTPGRVGYGTTPRAVRTTFVETWIDQPDEAAEQAEAIRTEIIDAAQQGRIHEFVPFAGESAGLIHEILPVAEIIQRLLAEAEAALERGRELAGS